MSDPSVRVPLPPSVEAVLEHICAVKSKRPPNAEARKCLASLGENASLEILQRIAASTTPIRTLTGYIFHMAKDYGPGSGGVVALNGQGSQSEQQQHKAESTPMRVQEQLDDVCHGLSLRLQECKSENAHLEQQLIGERELSKSYEACIEQILRDLSAAKSDVTKVESNMAEALAAKNTEIETLTSSINALKKQTALSEESLASLQANMEAIMRNSELTETRMIQVLREDLASAERRAEEEHAAHNATKTAAMEREVELEHRAIEASTALARIQRTVDEKTAKAADLEQKVALLEVECASLNQEVQDMEARARGGQKKSPEEANQVLQAWQEEVEHARQAQRGAESKISSMEAEVQKMRVEMSAMKRDAEHYKRQLEAERDRVSRRASSTWEEDAAMKALEPLPLHHRPMVRTSAQLQKAVKLLDSGAIRATRFLWKFPTARVLLFFYLVFVHLFLMYLLYRFLEQADSFASKEYAESMGHGNQTLPPY